MAIQADPDPAKRMDLCSVMVLLHATLFTLIGERSSTDGILRILLFCSWCSGYVSRMLPRVHDRDIFQVIKSIPV